MDLPGNQPRHGQPRWLGKRPGSYEHGGITSSTACALLPSSFYSWLAFPFAHQQAELASAPEAHRELH
jgi:hypothetical protein